MVPQPDLALARSFLAFLTGTVSENDPPQYNQAEQTILARWLAESELGAFACTRCRDVYPALARIPASF